MSETGKTFSLVPGRSCGTTCNLCCKVYPLEWVDNKPAGQWCKHCKPGRGCDIWQNRPDPCVKFHCQWMYDASLGPEWKPEISRFVMNMQGQTTLAVAVDPGNRNAWKREPYYSSFKNMVPALFQSGMMIIVNDGIHKMLLTPDHDIVVGKHNEHVDCELRCEGTGAAKQWIAFRHSSSSNASEMVRALP